MNALEMFTTCRNSSGYKKTWLGADWKIIDGIMYFEKSNGKLDWTFNLLSAFRIPGRLGGTWFLFPFGAWCMWKTLKKVIKKNPVTAYIGYSQGGWWTAYSSAETGLPGFTFGCPKLGKGQAYLFGNVTHRKNPGDVVTMVPPWAEIYGRVMLLNKQIKRPDGLSEVEWLSHHAPEEYIARLS